MLRFLIVDDASKDIDELIIILKKASYLLNQYPHITLSDKEVIYNIVNFEEYDLVFIKIDGCKSDSKDFRCADYIRSKNSKMLMTFYSQTITKNVAKRLYEYFPANYLQIPIDIEKIMVDVKRICEFSDPHRVFIKTKQGCIIKNVLDLLYYDTKKNVIYADKKIKVYNKKKEYQQYIVDQLKMEGFFLMKDRYWINRFESRIDKFSVDELMKKNKESDAFMYRRIH